METESRFLTLQQTSTYLNLPLSMIYRLSAEGRLPGKVCWGNRTVRVDREILEEWLSTARGVRDA